ncbi:MAG: fimbrillin family protein [Rikenellaceae bacterium]
MKKILYIISAVGLIVSSCSKDFETNIDSNALVAASFNGASITRVVDNMWQEGDQIGVYAYDTEGDIYDSYSNIPYENISDGAVSAFDISGTTTIYYPTNGNALTFLAYSPYQDISEDYVYSVDVSDQTDPALIDLIISDEGKEYSKSNPTAELSFSHVLSKLSMDLKVGEGLTSSELEDISISINGISVKGTYNLADNTIITDEDGKSVNPLTVTNGTDYEAILIPGTYSAMEVTFNLKDGVK